MPEEYEELVQADSTGKQLYVTQEEVDEALQHMNTPFHQFCYNMGITKEHLAKFLVGGEASSKKTSFFQADKNHQVYNRRLGLFDAEGYLKSKAMYHLRNPKDSYDKYGRWIFGAHTFDANLPTCLTKDEPTAVVGAFFYPDYNWLSCHATTISDEEADFLQERHVISVRDAKGNLQIERKLNNFKCDLYIFDAFTARKDDATFANIIAEHIAQGQELPDIAAKCEQADDTINFNVPDDQHEIFQRYGLFFEDNCIYVAKSSGKPEAVSNFTIRPLYYIKNDTHPKRLVEMVNCYNYKELIDAQTKEFTSLDRFVDLVESRGNYLFRGNKNDLNKLKSYIYDCMDNCREIEVLGWVPDGFWAFANGIYAPQTNGSWKFKEISEYGIVNFNEQPYFLKYLSNVNSENEEEYKEEQEVRYVESKITFKKWAELFVNAYRDNGRITLLYYIASVFRDIIYPRSGNNFPHLFGFGETQAGKTKLGDSLDPLFYELANAPSPQSLSGASTAKAFIRKAAQRRNFIVRFEEYKNNMDFKKIEALKNLYDGIGYDRAKFSDDNRTQSTPVRSAFYIVGQHMPTADVALFTRCILLPFERGSFTEEQTANYTEIKRIESNYGLTHLTAYLCEFRELFADNFLETWKNAFSEFKEELSDYNMEDRIFTNYAILMATFRVLKNVLPFPFSEDEIKQLITQRIIHQNQEMSSSKDTSVFWDIVEYLVDRSPDVVVTDRDYKVERVGRISVMAGKDTQGKDQTQELEFDDPKQVLFMRLKVVHPAYEEAHRRQYNQTGLRMNEMAHYLRNSKAYLGTVKAMRFSNACTSAMAFDYDRLGVDLIRDAGYGEDRKQERAEQQQSVYGDNGAKSRDETPF